MNATTRHSSVPGSSRRSRRTGAAGPEGARLAAAAALTLALLLAACGGPLAGGDPTMVTARLSANVPGAEAGGLSPQGFPYDPASGAIASTVRVYVFDEEGEQVSFQVSGTTYTAAPSGEEFITLTPEASSVTVRLPASGNPYRFEALGETDGSVVAYDSETVALGADTEVSLALRSVLGGAVLVPRLPTTAAVPGQVLDLMLVVMANGHADFPGDYLQVSIGDFAATYDPVGNATVLASSPRGVRLQVDAYCFDAVTVEGGVAGLVAAGDAYAPGQVGFNGGAGYQLPCLSSSAALGVDMVPPSVTITGYDPVTGVVTGEASDDVGVGRIELYDGPVLLATTELADATGEVARIEFEPLSTAFSATLQVLPLGRITAVAVDTSGNEAQSEPFLPANVLYVEAGAPAGGDGSAERPFASVQAGINAVAPGGTVFVRDGTYTEPQLNIGKPLTLVGESRDGTVIQVTTTEYGVKVHSSDVTIANLTILAAPSGAVGNMHYGVKVSTLEDPSDELLSGILITDVTVKGFNRSEIDLLRVDGAVLRNVTADGMGLQGVGIGIAGSRDVALVGVHTTGNEWGGVGLWVTDKGPLYSVRNVYIDATSTFDEPFGVYSETKNDVPEGVVDQLVLEGFTHAVRNPDHRPDGGDRFTFYTRSWEEAHALATSAKLEPIASSTVQLLGADADGYTVLLAHYLVGPGMSREAAEQAGGPDATIEEVDD